MRVRVGIGGFSDAVIGELRRQKGGVNRTSLNQLNQESPPVKFSHLIVAALVCGTANAQRIEAEDAYFSEGEVMTDPDGAQFVRVNGTASFVFETMFPEGGDAELVLCTRAGSDDAIVDLRIEPTGSALAVLPHTSLGDWATTSIPVEIVPMIPVMVTATVRTSSDIDVNYFEPCNSTTKDGPCKGCALGPWAGTYFEQGEKEKVEFPSIGKLGDVPGVSEYTKILTSIGITATSIDDAWGEAPVNGGCGMQRPEGAEECAEKKCLPSKECGFRSRVRFTPNNYLRPYGDYYEDVVLPDGTKRSFTRDSNPAQDWLTVRGKCNKARHIVWKFERRARVIQTLTCLPCEGQDSSSSGN